MKTALRTLIEDTIEDYSQSVFCYVYDEEKGYAVRVDPDIVTRLKAALKTGGIVIGDDPE